MAVEGEREPGEPGYPVESVGRALALLTLLHDQQRLRVMDVSRMLGIAPSTAHRLLAMFERSGFLRQEARNSTYSLGPALISLATAIAAQLEIGSVVLPHLLDLVRDLDETAHVCVLRGANAMFLDCVESTQRVRATSRKGRAIPAYATAGGKALLSELSLSELERIYPEEDLRRLTRKTIATRAALVNELRRIRERGYAVNGGESELEFASCAAVIRDRAGVARASIVIASPAARFRRYDARRVAEAVRAACSTAGALI